MKDTDFDELVPGDSVNIIIVAIIIPITERIRNARSATNPYIKHFRQLYKE